MARTQVQSELIATNAISGTIIADGAITSTHLAANSVDTAELVTGSIDTIHIAANQVTSAKIASNSILTRHIQDDQISGDQLTNNITIAGTLTSTGNITGTLATAAQTNITSVGTLASLAITGDLDIADTGAGAITVGGTTNTYSAPVVLNVTDIGLAMSDGTKTLATWATHGGSSHAGSGIGTRSNHDLAILTNDTKRIVIDTSGKVGIGTTGPSHDLHVYHSTNASDTMIFADNLQTSQSGADYNKYGIIGQTRGSHSSWSRGVGVVGLSDAATFHKAIGVYAGLNTTAISGFGYDSALYADGNDLGYAGTFMNGKVGIGTNAPNEPLTIRSSGENINCTLLEIGNDLHATNTKDAWIKFVCGAATNDYSWAAGAYPTDFRFSYLGARATAVATAANVRLQISSGGRLTYNDTGTDNGHGNFVGEVGSGYKALSFERTVGGGEVGSVVANASSTTYNTSSDYRLKENIDYSWDATTRLKQLKPARFNWIKDDTNTLLEGFLAHEVSSIVPEAVSGEKDAMADPILYGDGDELPAGKKVGDVKKASAPDYQGIDQSKLVPLMVKTIQELEARIKTLEDS